MCLLSVMKVSCWLVIRQILQWYVGGINGKNEERELEFSLPEACKELSSTWITDGKDKDSFGNEVISVIDGKVKVKLLANGGFAGTIR